MIVLDYPKTTSVDEPTLIVPPFHTGHLGFVPDTEVVVGLVKPQKQPSADSELTVTPFSQRETADMAVLTAVMRDDVGVVERLVRALADLDVNVETEESSSISHLKEHSVTLVCDVSQLDEDRPLRDPQRHLREYTASDDQRLLTLVENVLLHCADVLAWKDEPLPRLALNVRMLAGRKIKDTAPVTLDRAPKGAVAIVLPENIANGVRKAQTDPGADHLHYILISDTEDRSLRVYFLPERAAANVYHVGLVHADRPGALAALLRLTKAANFNILTSLVRKETVSYSGRGRSVWEAVLEYRGEATAPKREDHLRLQPPPIEWIRDQLAAGVGDDDDDLMHFAVAVRAPSYPKIATPSNSETPPSLDLIPDAPTRKEQGGRSVAAADRVALTKRQRAAITELPKASRGRIYLTALFDQIERRSQAPTIFLSYPVAAREHAKLLKAALEIDRRFSVIAHDQPDAMPIVAAVVQKIISSDYFIGLWHHEELPIAEGGGYTISPWMHFEYGIALANHKDTIVVHSDKLPDKLWKRINPGINQPEYTDLTFLSDTIPLIVNHCVDRFAEGAS